MLSRRKILAFLGVAPIAPPIAAIAHEVRNGPPWPVLPIESELRARDGSRVILFGVLPAGHQLGLHIGCGRILQGMIEGPPGVWHGMGWHPNGKYYENEPQFDIIGLDNGLASGGRDQRGVRL